MSKENLELLISICKEYNSLGVIGQATLDNIIEGEPVDTHHNITLINIRSWLQVVMFLISDSSLASDITDDIEMYLYGVNE